MRFLGFLTGSALTGLVAYLMAGAPSIGAAPKVDRVVIDSAPPAPQALPEPAGGAFDSHPLESGMSPGEDSIRPGLEAESLSGVSIGESSSITTSTGPSGKAGELEAPGAASAAGGSRGDETELVAKDSEWETFFVAFRSQASADGFARHLQASTGREFRVNKAGPGRYLISFRVTADEDRAKRIEEIESISGLRLKGGDL